MYGKMQESGLTEVIPFTGTSAIWGQFPVFSYPESPRGAPSGGWLMAWWWPCCLHPEFPQGSPSGWLHCDGCSILCLLIWQAIFFIHHMMPRTQHWSQVDITAKRYWLESWIQSLGVKFDIFLKRMRDFWEASGKKTVLCTNTYKSTWALNQG